MVRRMWRMVRWVWLWMVLAVGCEASIPDGRFECVADSDCPPGQRCDVERERCVYPDGG